MYTLKVFESTWERYIKELTREQVTTAWREEDLSRRSENFTLKMTETRRQVFGKRRSKRVEWGARSGRDS